MASHDVLPIVRLWGCGDVASADGVRFIVRGQPIHAGYNPKYFGRKRGVTWYNLVSDQSTGLGGVSVPGTLRNSMVILGLLLEQETHFDPREMMTDTAAYSDVVFGLFWAPASLTRGHFPNDRAATKLVYLALRLKLGWRAPPLFWHQARPEFSIRFGERFVVEGP